MFRKMRRSGQQISQELCYEILKRGSSGVLAVIGDNGYPYAVPLSYVYSDGKIFLHCAKTGHKIDALRNSCKVSFCVVDRDEIVPEKYTTFYRSVIVFGRANILENKVDILNSIKLLAKKYNPDDSAEHRNLEIQGALDRLCMIEISIEHITGKESIETIKQENSYRLSEV